MCKLKSLCPAISPMIVNITNVGLWHNLVSADQSTNPWKVENQEKMTSPLMWNASYCACVFCDYQ